MTTIIGTIQDRPFMMRGTPALGLIRIIKEYVQCPLYNGMVVTDMGIYIEEIEE